MNLDKYKIPMGELPSNIKKSIQEEIQNCDFLGFQHAFEIHKEKTFSIGICRDSKGAVLVTCITNMPQVIPKMIDWWFGWHMPETERYKLWHPRDHISSKLTVDTSGFKTDKEIKNLKKSQKEGENPRNIKFLLAEEIVDRFHGNGEGSKARNEFILRFQKGEPPSDIKEISIKISEQDISLPRVLKEAKMVASTSIALRLIKQGAVKIEGEKTVDPKHKLSLNSCLLYQVGKRRFLKIKILK
mgnify:CR=1 FL=1